jgi:hypothetical protein
MHIAETVKANFLFSHLNEVQRTTIFEVMEKVNVVADEVSPQRHLILPCCSRDPMLIATARAPSMTDGDQTRRPGRPLLRD